MQKITHTFIIIAIAALFVPSAVFAAPKPVCVSFEASETTIDAGDRVRLEWETKNGTRVEIDPIDYHSINEKTVEEGHVTVFPKKDTTYTLTVSKGTAKDTCDVSVDVKSDTAKAGTTTDSKDESQTPGVTVTEVRDQGSAQVISMASLPYTGIATGPLLSSLFFILLALWIAAMIYVATTERKPLFTQTSAARPHSLGSAIPHAEYHAKAKEFGQRF